MQYLMPEAVGLLLLLLFNLDGFLCWQSPLNILFMYITPTFGLKPQTENSITWISCATQIIELQKHLTDKHECVKMYIQGRRYVSTWMVDG